MDDTVEVRCPVGPRQLLIKLRLGEESGRRVDPGNLMELSCNDCSRRLSRERNESLRVLHQFNFAGELVRTVAEFRVQSRS